MKVFHFLSLIFDSVFRFCFRFRIPCFSSVAHKGQTIRKVMSGGGANFEPQEFFSLSNSLYEFFVGHSMNIF